ncbi:MAG: transporter [Candidatus Sabulitectum sp.]|nr:transporter [Candidatus Sabulitectum sp.]
MRRYVLILLITTAAAFSASWSIGPGGLSGWPGLPCSDILEVGLLKAGIGIEYIDTDNGSILRIPLKACWGVTEGLEAGAVIPVVPVDSPFGGSVMGDITLSGGWLYEKARGGTTLKFTGRLTLPTGEKHRDTGAELAFGGVSSATFRDFRLSMSAEYALNGGRNPFDDAITDVMYFTAGGSSFVTSDILIYAGMNGSTSPVFKVGAGAQYLLYENLAVDGGLNIGLDGIENFELYTGVSWTGEGF